MNNSLSRILERATLVTLASAISSAVVLHQVAEGVETRKTLRAERIEIVDANGVPCVTLEAGNRGGSITLSSPRRGEGKEGIIAYIGSTFGNDMTVTFREPKPDSKTGVGIFLGGEPSYPRITGTGGGGKPYFSLGGIGSERPMLQLWHLHEEEPYFSK